MVLPAGSTLPPLPQTVLLAVAVGVVAWALWKRSVEVTDLTVLAFTPWMVAGAALYVVYQLSILPGAIAPFFSSPAVYVTTATVAGVVWLLGLQTDAPLQVVWGAGAVTTLFPVGIALLAGASAGTLSPVLPLLGVLVAFVLGAVGWLVFMQVRTADATVIGIVGPLVLFSHALDGVSTAIGVDLLGFAERTPLSRIVLDAAAALPTADVIGVGWFFVLVKLVLAGGIVALMAGYVREDPTEGFSLMALVTAVGLGPGAHNILLFIVLGPAGF